MKDDYDIDAINKRNTEREAKEKKLKYKQAKEIIYEVAGQAEGMEDYIQIARQGDYKMEEKEKADNRFLTVILIGIPIVLVAYGTGMINWLVIAGIAGIGILSIAVNR